MCKRLPAAIMILTVGAALAAAAMAAQSRGSTRAPNDHSAGSPAASETLGPSSPAGLLRRDSKLAAKLARLFPDGADLVAQAGGFKSVGQFVLAVHVSHNLGIPFDNLKCAELGTTAASKTGLVCSSLVTNEDPISLGEAIHMLRPDANSERAVQGAHRQTEKNFTEAESDGKPDSKS